LSHELSGRPAVLAGPLLKDRPTGAGGGPIRRHPVSARLWQSWLGLTLMATVSWQLYLVLVLPQACWTSAPLTSPPTWGPPTWGPPTWGPPTWGAPIVSQGVWWIDLPCLGLSLLCIQSVFFLPGPPLLRLTGVVLSLAVLQGLPAATQGIGQAVWHSDAAAAATDSFPWLSPFAAVLLTGGASSIALRRAGRWTMEAKGADRDAEKMLIPPAVRIRDGLEWTTVAAVGFTGTKSLLQGRLPGTEDLQFAVVSLVCVMRLITLCPDVSRRRRGRAIGLVAVTFAFAWIIASHQDPADPSPWHRFQTLGSACAAAVVYWFVTKVPILWLQMHDWQWTHRAASGTPPVLDGGLAPLSDAPAAPTTIDNHISRNA